MYIICIVSCVSILTLKRLGYFGGWKGGGGGGMMAAILEAGHLLTSQIKKPFKLILNVQRLLDMPFYF